MKKLRFFFPQQLFSYGVFANKGSGAVPGRLPGGRFQGRFRITGSGQVPIHEFREVSGAGPEPRVSVQVSGDRVPAGWFQNGSGQKKSYDF